VALKVIVIGRTGAKTDYDKLYRSNLSTVVRL